ncbi:MAG: aldehyde dehydrogenase family protein [Solirubrobacteraceae bacterium]|nr:aldehyde dehydrogenase family protein [Solirubrobacteraceae bacterium]
MATADTTATPEHTNGNGASARAPIAVANPATGEIVAHVPDRSPEEVRDMVARARAAQPGWDALGYSGRGAIMKRLQLWALDHAEELVNTIQSETGKTYEDAFAAEVSYAASAFGFWADEAEKYLAPEKIKSSSPMLAGRRMEVRYRPLGVIGVIGPWNYPFTNSIGDAIPALMAGNTVVLKPSEVTPLTSLLIEKAARDCGMPEDVLIIATGRGETGAALIDEVDMIMFTGSTATGKKVMAKAAETLTPVSLELGGKDAMIVLADANLERAANAAVYFSMFNSGQTCISVERVYVEAPVYDEFIAKVTEKMKALRQGHPSGPGSMDVGAITFDNQMGIIEGHVKDALGKGARALTGGRRGTGPGNFFEPTLLVDVDHTMSAMTEETFGPTLPVMKVADAEEAIKMANDSPYGLAASVFSGDQLRGEQIARRIEAGAVCVNDALVNYFALELPMGGWKTSGMGSRHGAGGIKKYTRQQSILVNKFPLKKDLYMFPHGKMKTKAMGKVTKFIYGRGKRD